VRQAAILNKLVEAEGLKGSATSNHGTKRFGLDGAEAMIPALEQITSAACAGVKTLPSAWPIAAGSVCSPTFWRSHIGNFHEFKAARRRPTRSTAPETSNITLASHRIANSIKIPFTCR